MSNNGRNQSEDNSDYYNNRTSGYSPQRRKKTRSRKKNLRRDTRTQEKKPEYLQNNGDTLLSKVEVKLIQHTKNYDEYIGNNNKNITATTELTTTNTTTTTTTTKPTARDDVINQSDFIGL